MRTCIVATACLAFLAGIAIASAWFAYAAFVPTRGVLVGVAVSGAFLVLGARRMRRERFRVLLVVCIACGAGLLRFALLPGIVSPPALATYGEPMILEGIVSRITERPNRSALVRLRAPRITSNVSAQVGAPFALPVLLIFPRWDGHLAYGDVIRVRCAVLPPQHLADRLAIAGRCTVRDARVTVLATGGGSQTIRVLLALHAWFVRTIDAYVAPVAAGIVDGVLLGAASGIPNPLRDAFRATGTIHVLVVSGWHMSFIGLQLRRWIGRTGAPRALVLALTFVVLTAFTIMVGISASAVRGALVVAAILIVEAIGRIANPMRALLLVATAMAAIDPRIIAFDLSAQLSFAATAGLLLGTPILSAGVRWIGARLTRVPWCARTVARCPAMVRGWGTELVELLTASLAASLATTPLILAAFGTIAPIAPIVNIPVLLLTPALMASGALVLCLAFFPPFAAAAGAVAAVFGTAIASFVTWAASLPGSSQQAVTLDGWFVAACYVLLGIVVLAWYRKRGIAVLLPALPGSPSRALPEILGR